MKTSGIFYGSSTGNTETVAQKIAHLFENEITTYDVVHASASDLQACSNIILGCSTWGFGEIQDDFDAFLSILSSVDLTGKKIALFGLGDQESYPDTFVEAMGLIYDILDKKGYDIIGKVSAKGYSHSNSGSERDGFFVGLPLDEDNEYQLTEKRLVQWTEQLKKEFN